MATRQQLTEDFLTCVVCHEVFTDPVTLHCGHTVCAECVTGFLKTQAQAIATGVIPCPSCRGLTKVPEAQKPVEEWVGQIKTGFFVKSLVETLSASPEVEEQLCSVCIENGKQQPASSYCGDCKKDYCADCAKWHNIMLKDHKTQKSSEAAARKSKPSTRFCPEHAQCPMDMMCEDCDKVLCQKCCIVYHRRCESVITLEQAVGKMDVVLEKQLLTLDQDVCKLNTDVNLTKTKVEMLEESADKAEKDVDTACEKIMSVVLSKKTQVKERIAKIKESAVQDLKADVKNEEMKLEDAQQKQGLIRQALMSEVPMDHYEVYKICTPGKVEYQSSDRPTHKRVTQIEFSQDKNTALLENLEESGIGDVKLTTDEGSNSHEECNDEATSSDEDPIEAEDVSKRKYELMRTLDTGLHSIRGIAVLTAGDTKVVVSAGYRYVKAFYDKNGKPEHSCLFFESEPKDVFKVSDSEAAVCIDSTLVIIKVTPNLETVSVVKLPRVYQKITAKNSESFIAFYKEDYHQKGIDTFDLSGRIVQSISVENSISSISSLVVTSSDHIMFSSDKLIYCVDYQGKQLFKLNKDQYTNITMCLWGENGADVCAFNILYDRKQHRVTKASVTLLATPGSEVVLLDQFVDFQPRRDTLIATDSDGLIYFSQTYENDTYVTTRVLGF